ncbi:MAG TPA: DUF1801 domain-containing protein [Parafilimonas sp.]|nr:DUF1801 domain-containing protein [Parafilimonas sp.]
MTKSSNNMRVGNIDEYIAGFPSNIQVMLQELRGTIIQAAPEVEETISYNIPAFKLHGAYLIYFAGWKNHISLYPFSSEMDALLPEAAAYKTSGKGTIQFPTDKPLPLDLVERIIKLRIQESRNKINIE